MGGGCSGSGASANRLSGGSCRAGNRDNIELIGTVGLRA